MYCIQETDKPNFIFKTFNIISLIQNKIILPITGDEILSNRKATKLVRKTLKILEKTMSKRVVISKKIQNQKKYLELLKAENLEIVDGRWLFEILSYDVLEYIVNKRKMKKEETKVSILVNNLTDNIVETIRIIAREYKRVNIITNYMEKFKKIEEQMLQKDGIMITVGNNKRKGLSKSHIILNVDFSSKALHEYNIFENAIIVNLREKAVIYKKRFNGITINNYDITYRNIDNYDYDKDNKYKACEIYEAQVNKKQPFYEIMKKIKNDKVAITKLMGKNAVY